MDSLRAPMQKFAISLFQACRKLQPDGNILYSPMIASTGLLLILLGSDGETRAEIENAMKIGDSPLFNSPTFEHDLKMAYRYVLAMIHKAKAKDEKADRFKVFRVNRLFLDSSISLRQDFVEQVEKLKAEVGFTDFENNLEGARRDINYFVEERMNGKVSDCFKKGVLEENSKMVLVNGVSFKARWDITFDPANTTLENFRHLDGSTSMINMMHGTFQLPYVCDESIGVTYVELPYILNIASLLLFLPVQKSGLKQMSRNLNPFVINKINLAKRLRDVKLSLPKFKLRTQLDMKALFRKLGVNSLAGGKINLSRMTADQQPITLSAAVHNGYFSVNEKGTDADDSSDDGPTCLHVNNATSSFSDERKIKRTSSLDAAKCSVIPVVVDQPFLFAVRHNRSGIMICLGRVENLSEV